jgi:hypothetical protein
VIRSLFFTITCISLLLGTVLSSQAYALTFSQRAVLCLRQSFNQLLSPSVVTETDSPSAKVTPPEAPEIHPWSMSTRNLALQPEDILPESYVEALRRSVGEVKVVVHNTEWRTSRVEITAGEKLVAKFRLQESWQQEQPGVLTIENLVAMDPLAQSRKTRLGQLGKGLPANVFSYAKQQIFKIAKAGGYSQLQANSSNFTVNMLYRKSIGLEPGNPEAAMFQSYLDKLFKFSLTLPGPLRIRSLDDFSRATAEAPRESPEVLKRWNNYLKTRVLPEGLEILLMDGQPAALVDHEQPEGRRLFFLRPPSQGSAILNWYEGRSDPERQLIRKIP